MKHSAVFFFFKDKQNWWTLAKLMKKKSESTQIKQK